MRCLVPLLAQTHKLVPPRGHEVGCLSAIRWSGDEGNHGEGGGRQCDWLISEASGWCLILHDAMLGRVHSSGCSRRTQATKRRGLGANTATWRGGVADHCPRSSKSLTQEPSSQQAIKTDRGDNTRARLLSSLTAREHNTMDADMPDLATLSDTPPTPRSGTSRRRTRTRTTTACSACRARRTRCDSRKPDCGFCLARGLKCHYAQSESAPTPTSR